MRQPRSPSKRTLLRRSQRGQAMAEYLYALPLLLLLILGSFQMALIYQARHTLKYAAFMAARAGALGNGSMSAIEEGAATGLAPLFTHGKTSDAMKKGRQLADTLLGDANLTEIRILNPTSAALSGHQGDSEAGDSIPNDNLMYRDSGSKGGMSVQDANLLKVRVRICLRMVVPIVNKLVYTMVVDPSSAASVTPDSDKTATSMLQPYNDIISRPANPCAGKGDYYLPVEAESVVRMQTPFKDPGKWIGP